MRGIAGFFILWAIIAVTTIFFSCEKKSDKWVKELTVVYNSTPAEAECFIYAVQETNKIYKCEELNSIKTTVIQCTESNPKFLEDLVGLLAILQMQGGCKPNN